MGIIAWLFESVWGRRVLALAVILLVAAFVREHYIREGKEKAIQEAGQNALKTETSQWREEHDAAMAEIRAQQDTLRSLTESIAASRTRERALETSLAQVAGRRQEVDAATAKVPDSELHGQIIQRLAVRDPNDKMPGYTAAEERALLHCVNDQPLFVQQADLLQKQVSECKQQVTSLDQKTAVMDQQYRTLYGYTTKLESHYVDVFNALAAKRRGPQCLWIWKCAKQTIAAPKPSDLAPPNELAPAQ